MLKPTIVVGTVPDKLFDDNANDLDTQHKSAEAAAT